MANRQCRLNRSNILTFIFTVLLPAISLVGFSANIVVGQEDAIAQTALNAQNDGEFEFAASQWERLIQEHADSPLLGAAYHNLGVCRVQVGMSTIDSNAATAEFTKAQDALKQSLTSLKTDEVEKLARSFIFLGFSQAKIGKNLLSNNPNETQQEEARKWLTTATQTLEQLQKRYPDFGDLDQAFFFQGEAFESLGQFENAAKSYESMLKLPGDTFRNDGILALGTVYEQLDQFDQAIKYYDEFLASTANDGAGDNPLASEARFRKAETLLKKADVAIKNGQDAIPFYNEAEKLFSVVSADTEFDMVDRALFQAAFAANFKREFEKAANLYLKVADIAQSPLAPRAMVYAGRDFMNAGQLDKASTTLVAAMATQSEYAPEAAHWMSQLHLRNRQNNAAFELSDRWVKQTKPDHRMFVNLLLDRADAAYLLDDRRAESPKLFMEICDKFSKHPLAATALYNAAFAQLETGKFQAAIDLVDRFQKDYQQSDYLPDALEVKADAALLANQPQIAESVFRRLVQDYAANAKAANWNLRIGLAQYMQENYSEAINWLGTTSRGMSPVQMAEALHWIGSSHFNLKQDADAIASLQQSLNTDPNWRRADETMMTLSRAQLRSGKNEEASATMALLLKKFPQSQMVAQTFYRIGEMAYAKNDFETAFTNYKRVVDEHPQSEYAPFALYGAGWSAIERKQFETSIKLFDRLEKDFPEHERAKLALVGRGVCRRQAGDAKSAISDFSKFLSTSPTGQIELDALYERGLAEVDLQDWPAVVSTFAKLLQKSPESKLADRFHYELAWAHRNTKNPAQALRHFADIVKSHPDSPLAAEANFHVANAAYDEKEFEAAAEAYRAAIAKSKNASLKEKATYKLGWCAYKQKNYAGSLEHFRQQVNAFPEGSLKADGLLMVSDSLYRLEKHQEAFEAYRVAKPALEASETVSARIKWQALLHGGQSANKAGSYQEALNFVQPIVESESAPSDMKFDAFLEIGNANKGLNRFDAARSAWAEAATSISETGAEARCLIGESLFEQKQFDAAVREYKLVFYGYGGKQAEKEIRPWQSFAAFEAGQCYFVQLKEASPELRKKLAAESLKHFNHLVKNYPEDRLINDAKKRIDTLQRILE